MKTEQHGFLVAQQATVSTLLEVSDRDDVLGILSLTDRQHAIQEEMIRLAEQYPPPASWFAIDEPCPFDDP